MKKRFLLLTALLVCSFGFTFAQVDVTATAGNPAATYTTLGEALNAINDGTHQGDVDVRITANITETNTATLFGPTAPANYTNVVIGPGPLVNPAVGVTVSMSDQDTLLHLIGANNVTIDGRVGGSGSDIALFFLNSSTGTTPIRAIALAVSAGSANCTMQFVEFDGVSQNIVNARLVEISGANNNDIVFDNCVFFNGRTLLTIEGGGNTITVKNCQFIDGGNGIFTNSTFQTINIDNCTFLHVFNVSAFNAIGLLLNSFSPASTVFNITNNLITQLGSNLNTSTNNVVGILMQPPASGNPTYNVINNMVSLMLPNDSVNAAMLNGLRGISTSLNANPAVFNLYHNTVRIGGVSRSASFVMNSVCFGIFNSGANTVLRFRNNIADNVRTAVNSTVNNAAAWYRFNGTFVNYAVAELDNNFYYANGSVKIGLFGLGYSDIFNYRTALGGNRELASTIGASSLNYVSDANPTLAGASLTDANLIGAPIAGITTDRFGTIRSTVLPFKGAFEGTNLPFIHPNLANTSVCRNDSITLSFTARDIAPGTIASIQLSNFEGNFSSGVTTLGSFPIQATGQIKVAIPSNVPPDSRYVIRIEVNSIAFVSQPSSAFSIGLDNCNNISAQLQPADCGKMDFILGGPAGFFGNVITAQSGITGAQSYRFNIYDSDDIFLTTISSPNRTISTIAPSVFQAGESYIIRLAIETEAGLGPLGPPCTIGFRNTPSAAEVPDIVIGSNACSSSLFDLQSTTRVSGVDFVNAIRNSLITSYEFMFETTVGNTTTTTNLFTPSANLFLREHTNFFAPGRTYLVKVRGYIGPTPGNFSPICTIRTIPTTANLNPVQIRPNLCGTAGFTIDNASQSDISGVDFMIAERLTDATAYEFEVWNNSQTAILGTIVTGIGAKVYPRQHTQIFQWGNNYRIRVRGLVGQAPGPWGDFCNIGMQANPASGVPSTRIRQCGMALNNDLIRANDVIGAAQYRFLFYSDAACTQLYATALSNVNLNLSTLNPALLPATNYYVLVNARIGTNWGTTGPGDTCLITTATAAPRLAFNGFDMAAYPNPFTNEINVVINNKINSTVNVRLFDLSGRLLMQTQIPTNMPYQLGSGLATGTYLLEATIGEQERKVIRIIKTN